MQYSGLDSVPRLLVLPTRTSEEIVLCCGEQSRPPKGPGNLKHSCINPIVTRECVMVLFCAHSSREVDVEQAIGKAYTSSGTTRDTGDGVTAPGPWLSLARTTAA